MVVSVVYLPKVYIPHYYDGVIVIKKNERIKSKMLKIEGMDKKKIRIYETYKNKVIPHGRNIYAKASNMSKSTICAYSQSYHALPNWKCVLRCCAKCPGVNFPDQETDIQYSNTSPSIRFHIYHLIARCTTYVRIPLNDKIFFRKCKQDYVSEQPTKIYTRKEVVVMETIISNFHTSLYIPEINKLAFHTPHVQILGTNHCGDSRWTMFKRRK